LWKKPGMALQFLISSALHARPRVFFGHGSGRHGVGLPALSIRILSPPVSGPLYVIVIVGLPLPMKPVARTGCVPAVRVRSAQYSEDSCSPSFLTTSASSMNSLDPSCEVVHTE